MRSFARTLVELKEKAVRFWPREILEAEADVSVLPLLLLTQDKFISVLNLADSNPFAWEQIVKATENIDGEMKGNLFLKHLMVLSDIGGEALNKIPPLSKYFPEGKMSFVWHEKTWEYAFKAIQNKVSLHNNALKVNGKALLKGSELDDKKIDTVMLLLHAGTSTNDSLPDEIKNRCVVGSLIGTPEDLERFVKQNYIRVSKQISGAASNAMGQLAQNYVIDKLKELLPDWTFVRDGNLPGVSHTGGNGEMTFDVKASSPDNMHFGIEVSFQVTTNSVIERKAGQAKERQERVHAAGHAICYVIDGAGNIDVREKAAQTICDYSDCTVALSAEEMVVLAEFMTKTAKKTKRRK